jgi:hypothetical protein
MKRCLLIIGVLFLCAKTGSGLTLAEARTEVRRLVKDTATSSTLQRYSDTVLLSFLNQAQREVISASLPLENTTSYTLSSGTTYYSLPTDLVSVKFIKLKDATLRTRKLQQVSYKATLESNPDYERLSGPPMQYFIRPSTSSTVTTLDVAFLPVPTTSSTGTATVTYYKQATTLSADSDVLLDGDSTLLPYHEAVVYGAVAKIKLIEGDPSSSVYLQLQQSGIQVMNSRLGEMPDYGPGLSAGSPALSAGTSR